MLVARIAPLDAPLELTAPAAGPTARAVRETLKRWLKREGLPRAAVEDLLIASGEAVANAITHAYPAGRRGPIHVCAERDGAGVAIVVRDEGAWRPARDADGMGLQLIRALGHGDVQSTETGTIVRMRWDASDERLSA